MKRLILILFASCGAVFSQQNALMLPWTPQQFTNTNGTVLANGKVCTYQAGTSTGQASYTDATAATPNSVPPNAVLLDSTGRPTSGGIWLKVGLAYKIVVLTAGSDSTCNTGVTIKSQDNVIPAALNAPVSGNNTFTGTNTFTGVTTLSGDTRLSNVGTFNVEEWVGTTQYPTLASALAAASASTLIHIPAGTFTISGTQSIALNNIAIIGDGIGSSFIQITSATANFFSLSGNGFELGNLTLNSSVTRTAGFVVVNGAGSGITPTTWNFHDLGFQDVYGGFQLLANNNNAILDVRLDHLLWRTTTALHSGSFMVIGGGSATVGDVMVNRVVTTSNGATYDAPEILIDTLADTVHFDHWDAGYSVGIAQTQPVFKFQNTLASTPPKFIRLNHIAIEGGGSASSADCMNIAAVADLDIGDSYFANCGNEAINISGGNNINGPVRIHHNWIGNNQKGGLYVSSAITSSADLEIDGNSFNANSINTTNTFDDIQIAANTIGFTITNNHNGNQVFNSANKSRYGANIIAGTSSLYWYAGNTCDSAQMGTACLLDGGTGSPKHVEFPNLFSTVTASANSSAPVLTMSDNAGRCGLITGVDSINNMRVGTCSNGQQLDLVSGNQVVAASLDGTTQNMTVKNVIASKGTACTNGELALSAGWQSTGSATVTAVAGTGQTCSWTITTGTTTAANPTVTDTLTNAMLATTVCEMNIHGGTHTAVAGEGFQQTTLSATAPIFTFNGTPTAGGTTYFVTRRCGP